MKKLTLITVLFLFPVLMSAHGLGGSIEQTKGEYILGIGYNTYELASNKTISLDFDLFTLNREPVPFAEVLVEISKDDKTLLSAFVPNPEFGYPIVDYFFFEGGNYKIDIKFIEKDEDGFNKGIVETSFDFPISEGRPWYQSALLIGGAVGLAVGVLAALLFLKRKK